MEKEMTSSQLSSTGVDAQYKRWFLHYASYVILERAIPHIDDGLKPVQRRILHAMNEMDDGRYNKVANIIGQSMQYHPHGDASIEDALVHMGQKDYLVDTQGNWGDLRTGDRAAAARYIEACLSKLAKKVAFQPDLTEWQKSYDGRKKEPVVLPMKFPLLLLHGADGIAVGLSTKVLPHNFVEICNAAVHHLRGKKVSLFPDFSTGGMLDVTNYQQGKRGGKVKIRSHIEVIDKTSVLIKDVPFSVTTQQLIDSIVKAGDQGKIKIKKITDNTAKEVSIAVEIAGGTTASQFVDVLYSFTKCQVSISPNACVIVNQTPEFVGVDDVLAHCVNRTQTLLKKELEIAIDSLDNQWHYLSLEKLFFEKQIYKELEKKHEAWEDVLHAIARAFEPYTSELKRPILREDIQKLVEKPVRRIYKLDIIELNRKLIHIEKETALQKKNLQELTRYTIDWFTNLKKDFGKLYKRKTVIQPFYEKKKQDVSIANTKLYANLKEGFVGMALKKDQYMTDCSDVDLIVGISRRGVMKVVTVAEKVFIDKRLIYVDIFQRHRNDKIYNVIYLDGKSGKSFAKRFSIGGVTRNKEYVLTQGSPLSRIVYFSAKGKEEPECVQVVLSPNCAARKKNIVFCFSTLSVANKNAKGVQLTKYPIQKVVLDKREKMQKARQTTFYYDNLFGRIHTQNMGIPLGNFFAKDTVFLIHNDGTLLRIVPEDGQVVNMQKMIHVEKYDPSITLTMIYETNFPKQYYIKRINLNQLKVDQEVAAIPTSRAFTIILVSTKRDPLLRLNIGQKITPTYVRLKTNELAALTTIDGAGKKITAKQPIKEMQWIE